MCDRVAYQKLLKENNILKKAFLASEDKIIELKRENLDLRDKLAYAKGMTYSQQVGY